MSMLRDHWPVYLMEAFELGFFMVSACMFAALLEHPASRLRQRITGVWVRRVLMGAAMGLTAVALIYSPWGQQSGAHMNPAVTLTFLLLGKVAPVDAVFYVIAQCIGAVLGVQAVATLWRHWLSHPSVNYVVTTPGALGTGAAWLAELTISFGLMLTVLMLSNHPRWARYTGLAAGFLVALYIAIEAPLSGMSINPARTLGSALAAAHWKSIWVYATAPLLGMLLAPLAYAQLPGTHAVYCAKLDHGNGYPCIFRCGYHETGAQRAAPR